MSVVHVVVPADLHDPTRRSGGNVYDLRLCEELAHRGWSVREVPVAGPWPRRDPGSLAGLGSALAVLPDSSLVLVDGLVASNAGDVVRGETDRLGIVVLVHMPLGHRWPGQDRADVGARERDVLAGARAVVTTSTWTRDWLLDRYALRSSCVSVAEPGVDPAPLAPWSASGQALLCVAAVTPDKGHDVVFEALRAVADLSWRCVCVGSLGRDPGFARALRDRVHDAGLAHRVTFTGPLVGAALDAAYAAADLLVLATRAETYAMVVTESFARGLPVVATDVGGVPQAWRGSAPACAPGRLVPVDDPEAFACALRDWLTDADLRARWRAAARQRRDELTGWSVTAERVSRVLMRVAGA
ncbi:glycosyltransferase family 4 protein [Nostocoides sp. HKS02]|uniref:glycosyltransferase family 4 protein n=1 Tax=Nostocoides sp. HKS02 TaxID=1813880 RepID=UPI001E544114|nr:glycosyltransferase family 4 protein [Tetrasphaera sp. HKS02]